MAYEHFSLYLFTKTHVFVIWHMNTFHCICLQKHMWCVSWSSQITNYFVLLNFENFKQWEYDDGTAYWEWNIMLMKMQGEGASWLWLHCSWIYNYLCNQCLSPLTLWVQTSLRRGTTLCDKVVSDLQQVGDFLQFPPSIFAVFVYKNTFGVSLILYK